MENSKTFDCNGNELFDGDSVSIIQDLKPKGADKIKSKTVIKNIRLVPNDNTHIECKISGGMFIKTCFVKKVTDKKKKKKK